MQLRAFMTFATTTLTAGPTLLCVLFLAGCAGHPDVRPGADGVHRVVIQTDDKDQGARHAISQANHYCKEKQKEAVFMTEDKKYTGTMDEDTYNNVKTASKVAKTVGGAVWVFGAKNESQLGGLAGLGGAAADEATGKGYTVEMRFKCQ